MIGGSKYRLHVNDRLFEIALQQDRDKKSLKIFIEGIKYIFTITPLENGCYGLAGQDVSGMVYVARTENGKEIFWRGRTYHVTPEKRMKKQRKGGYISESPMNNLVSPPMPSVVRRVLVNEGDKVKKGQALIVVTSMKMETTLVSPRDGQIKSVNTHEGAKVSPGDELIQFYEEEGL